MSDRQVEQLATACVARAAATSGGPSAMKLRLIEHLTAEIPELRNEAASAILFRETVERTVGAFVEVALGHTGVRQVEVPPVAIEHTRRLAQNGFASTALLRAYRLGHQHVVQEVAARIAQEERDVEVALAAVRMLQDLAFQYVDRVSERIAAEYEDAREQWLAHRNTVRSDTLKTILAGDAIDLSAAEVALGYKLRRNHLAAFVWTGDPTASKELGRLEEGLRALATRLPLVGAPLLVPQGGALGWAWLPIGEEAYPFDLGEIARALLTSDPAIRIALGTPGRGLDGFRSSHWEARRAYRVASVRDAALPTVTSFTDPEVRAVSLLVGDLPAARALVAQSLGSLADDNASAERLRETLLVYLQSGGSYVVAAERLHLHKNSVKYRVAKALGSCPTDRVDDKLGLELALLACRWLGRPVLSA